LARLSYLANNRTGRRNRRRREMPQAGAPKHAMKMGVRRIEMTFLRNVISI
jgi:hypothetical protein